MPTDIASLIETITNTDDYDATLAAVTANARGRWFLTEYMRRQRHNETERVLEAIARIEEMAQGKRELATDDDLRRDLAEIASVISALRGVDAVRAQQLIDLMHHLERRIAALVEPAAQIEETAAHEGAAEPAPPPADPLLLQLEIALATPVAPPVQAPPAALVVASADLPPQVQQDAPVVAATDLPPVPQTSDPDVDEVAELMPVDFVPAPPPSTAAAASASASANVAVDLAELEHELFAGLPDVSVPAPAAATPSASLTQPASAAQLPAAKPQATRPLAKPEAPAKTLDVNDPLAAFKAMTPEEQVAVFS